MAIHVSIAALAQQVPMTQITGLVRDSVSRQGIPYATVTLIGTDEGTLANEKGGFTINSRARFSRLRVSAMGYSPKDVEVKTVDLYIKPETGEAFYVVNGEGSADFRIEL